MYIRKKFVIKGEKLKNAKISKTDIIHLFNISHTTMFERVISLRITK